MIRLTRLNNQPITVNSDLIKFVESNPDTVLTLINGDKILVHESVDDVIARIIEFRRAVISGLAAVGNDSGASASTVLPLLRNQAEPAQTEGRSRG